MPFTFSHPAIILPFVNKRSDRFSGTSLIIGSIIPDFESFIRVDEHKVFSHTWPGIFWFDLPLGILFAFIFHGIIRDLLIRNMPNTIRKKFSFLTCFNWKRYFREHYLVVCYSMIIGIFSHLAWDSFTHLNIENPNAVDSMIYWGPVRVFILLQYSNSVIGLAAIAWYARNFQPGDLTYLKCVPGSMTGSEKGNASNKWYWPILGIVMLIVFTTALYIVPGPLNMVLVIDMIIAGGLAGLIITPGVLRLAPRISGNQ